MNDRALTLTEFNDLSKAQAQEALARCCGAARWLEKMLTRRPFGQFDELLIAADESFVLLEPDDWLEAFAHHPKIGDTASLRAKFASTATWASGEQAGVGAASEDEVEALAQGNEAYFQKFGYIFIVNATGKSAGEMLQMLMARLENDPETELTVAAAEQMKITRIRLHKLIRREP
jgi:2-oxo-4-hydroxy-4-carboxy-5-ureidoimidazoline decarboxylase